VTVNVVWALARVPWRRVCAAVIVTCPGRTVPGMRTKKVKLPVLVTVTSLATYKAPTLIETRPHGAGQNPLPVTLTVASGGPAFGVTAIARTAASAWPLGSSVEAAIEITVIAVIASLPMPTVRSYMVVRR
jgi:hypothetical protein